MRGRNVIADPLSVADTLPAERRYQIPANFNPKPLKSSKQCYEANLTKNHLAQHLMILTDLEGPSMLHPISSLTSL
jgi:hypothetical protein